MKTITENENNKNKAVVTTASSDWVIPVRNPTTGEECNIPLANLSSVVAGLYRMKIVEFRIAPLTTQTFGKVYGFFSLDCTSGFGYELYPIVGYCSASSGRKFLTSGYNNNASFDDNGRLVISNPSSATALNYKGIIIGGYIED